MTDSRTGTVEGAARHPMAVRRAFEASLPSGRKGHPIPATAAGGKYQGSATPCLSLAFDLCRVGSHTAASSSLLGSGSPEFRSQARGSGSPTHCHPSMSGGDTPTSIPLSAAPSLVPSKDDPRGSGSFTRSAEAAGSLASSGIWLMHSASVAPRMKPSSSSQQRPGRWSSS
jgi:hypothetical protein